MILNLIQGLGWIQGLGCRAFNPMSWIQDLGARILDPKPYIQGPGSKALEPGTFSIPWCLSCHSGLTYVGGEQNEEHKGSTNWLFSCTRLRCHRTHDTGPILGGLFR